MTRGRGVAVAVTAGLVLAGCGADDSGSTSAASVDRSDPLLSLACIEGDDLATGEQVKVGINVALSGQGAYYGDVMSSAAELAAEQIAAAGGPEFELVVKDHKSGDAEAGVATTRELGQEGVHLALYSFIGVLGAAFQGIEQYKILSLDGGGGTQVFGQGKPFFYGTRSQPPNDSFPGIAQYIEATYPDAQTASMIIGDTGSENVADSTELATAALEEVGVSLASTEVVTYGGNDFATAVTKILSEKPDVVISAQFGTDPGYFLKQYRGAGGEQPVIGTDLIPDALEIAGPEAAAGFVSAQEYFNAEAPGNEWGTFFVDSWTEAYPDKGAPDFYAANYYQDMFALWQTLIRAKAEGGDVDNSNDLLEAFTSDLTFPSVSGEAQEGKQCGSYSLDADSHTVASTTMGVAEVQADGTSIEQVASFDIGGADFALIE